MAKKRGAALRAKKRGDEAAEELIEKTIETEEVSKFEAKADEDLFMIDTRPDAAAAMSLATKKRKPSESRTASLNVAQTKKNRISEIDSRQIRKMMNTHSSEQVVSIAAATEVRTKQARRSRRNPGTANAAFDLWDDVAPANEETKMVVVTSGVRGHAGTAPLSFQAVAKSLLRKDIQQPAKMSKKRLKVRSQLKKTAQSSIRVEPAQPGQSYRPDEEQHQDAIGEALSIELRRKEALDYKNTPIGGGKMSEQTLALLIHTDDEESSDEEGDEGETINTRHKRKEKLTKAQRNKQKRVKALEVELKERRLKKKLLHQFDESKKVSKEVRKTEAAKVARRDELNALKAEKMAKPLGVNYLGKLSELDPINAPSLPVALSSELQGGSLRTVKPKGSLLTDRMESMISRKMANRKAAHKKTVVHGKKRKNMKGGKGREYLLA